MSKNLEELLKKKNELEEKKKELVAVEKEVEELEREMNKYWLPCIIEDQPIEYWKCWFYEKDLPTAINEAKRFIKELEDYVEEGKYLIERAERLESR